MRLRAVTVFAMGMFACATPALRPKFQLEEDKPVAALPEHRTIRTVAKNAPKKPVVSPKTDADDLNRRERGLTRK